MTQRPFKKVQFQKIKFINMNQLLINKGYEKSRKYVTLKDIVGTISFLMSG